MRRAKPFARAAVWAMAAALCGAALAGDAPDWRAIITAQDSTRLSEQVATRTEVVAQLRAVGAAPGVRAALAVLDRHATPIHRPDLIGAWRCRIIKIGGDPLVTPYGFFDCQIEDSIEGLVIHETSGSQRFLGRLLPESAASMLYLGALYLPIDGRPPGAYGADARMDQAGRLYRISRNELRIELPRPAFESDYDVIHLVRQSGRR